MSERKAFRVLLLTLLFIGSSTAQPKTQVTCDGSIFPVTNTPSITCNFHKNITNTKYGINVMRYPINASSLSGGTDILQCALASAPLGSLACVVAKGYTFEYVITDTLRLEVSSAGMGATGLYVCHVVPGDDFQSHACDLVLNDAVSFGNTTSPVKRVGNTTTENNCTQLTYLTSSADNCASQTTGLWILGCLTGLVVLAFVLLATCHLWGRNVGGKQNFKNNPAWDPEEQKPLFWLTLEQIDNDECTSLGEKSRPLRGPTLKQLNSEECTNGILGEKSRSRPGQPPDMMPFSNKNDEGMGTFKDLKPGHVAKTCSIETEQQNDKSAVDSDPTTNVCNTEENNMKPMLWHRLPLSHGLKTMYLGSSD